MQESVVAVAKNPSGPEYSFVVRAYHTVIKSLDFLNYIMPCKRQFD